MLCMLRTTPSAPTLAHFAPSAVLLLTAVEHRGWELTLFSLSSEELLDLWRCPSRLPCRRSTRITVAAPITSKVEQPQT